MYIDKVISYRGSWDLVSMKYRTELSEALDSIADYLSGNVELSEDPGRGSRSRELWEKALYDRG